MFVLLLKRSRNPNVRPYLEKYRDAEVHEGLREVDDALPRVVDGHRAHGEVCFLRARRGKGRQSGIPRDGVRVCTPRNKGVRLYIVRRRGIREGRQKERESELVQRWRTGQSTSSSSISSSRRTDRWFHFQLNAGL